MVYETLFESESSIESRDKPESTSNSKLINKIDTRKSQFFKRQQDDSKQNYLFLNVHDLAIRRRLNFKSSRNIQTATANFESFDDRQSKNCVRMCENS